MRPQSVFTGCTVPVRSAPPTSTTCTRAKGSRGVSGTGCFLVHEQHLIQQPQRGQCPSGHLHRLPDVEMPELLGVPVFFPVNYQCTQLSVVRPGSVWHQAPTGGMLGLSGARGRGGSRPTRMDRKHLVPNLPLPVARMVWAGSTG